MDVENIKSLLFRNTNLASPFNVFLILSRNNFSMEISKTKNRVQEQFQILLASHCGQFGTNTIL